MGTEQPADRLGLPADDLQGAVKPVVVVPDQPVDALVDAAGPLLGVDDEHAAWADHQMIHVGGRAGHGQVVEDHVAVARRAGPGAGRCAAPLGRRAARRGPARRGGTAAASRPARRPRGRASPALGRPAWAASTLAGDAGGGDQRRPPGQAAGPGGQLGGAAAPVGGQGGAAGAAQAAGDRLGRRRRRVGAGGVRGTPTGCPGGSRAAQPLPSSWAGWPAWASRNRWSSSAVRARTDRPSPW